MKLTMNFMENKLFKKLFDIALELGAYKAAVIDVKDISLDRSFRDMCTSNACGMYGRCYVCPPDVGNIEELMSEVKKYDYAFVYQTVTVLEDSYDFEGMIQAKKLTYPIAQKLRVIFNDLGIPALHLGAGGCGICETCAKQTKEPCRFPELALPSLEAYGINVSHLALASDMMYINGQNTVTYFGATLFSFDGEEK